MNIEKLRSAFEAWLKTTGLFHYLLIEHENPLLCNDNWYDNQDVQQAWEVWQAAHESKQAESVCLSESTKNEKQTDLSLVSDNQSVRVPYGWKLVPRKVTPQQLVDVGCMDGFDINECAVSPDKSHSDWYEAVVEAAPSLPVQSGWKTYPKDVPTDDDCDDRNQVWFSAYNGEVFSVFIYELDDGMKWHAKPKRPKSPVQEG